MRRGSIVVVGERFRWPSCLVPFEINHPNRQLVLDAIRHWEERTPISFVVRNATNAGTFPNFLVFEAQDGCFSQVGMRGGRQVISLGNGCGLGAAIHEIGLLWVCGTSKAEKIGISTQG
jgi:hypothetical protein